MSMRAEMTELSEWVEVDTECGITFVPNYVETLA